MDSLSTILATAASIAGVIIAWLAYRKDSGKKAAELLIRGEKKGSRRSILIEKFLDKSITEAEAGEMMDILKGILAEEEARKDEHFAARHLLEYLERIYNK